MEMPMCSFVRLCEASVSANKMHVVVDRGLRHSWRELAEAPNASSQSSPLEYNHDF